jgi:hypothetical protein
LRAAVDGHREREFLETMLGLSRDLPGGIRDPGVRDRADRLRHRHLDYPGMRPEYMAFVAGLLALSPLRVRDQQGVRAAVEDRDRYWRYITEVMLRLGAELGPIADVEQGCGAFVQVHAGESGDGRDLIAAFAARHARHVRQAIPALFPAARRVVRQALAHDGRFAAA